MLWIPGWGRCQCFYCTFPTEQGVHCGQACRPRRNPSRLISSINMWAATGSTAHLFIAREQKSRTGHSPTPKPYPIRPAHHDIYIKQDRQGPGRGAGKAGQEPATQRENEGRWLKDAPTEGYSKKHSAFQLTDGNPLYNTQAHRDKGWMSVTAYYQKERSILGWLLQNKHT